MPWELTGNTGIDSATNFLGTTDNEPLVIRTNGAERLHITPNGNVGIGTYDLTLPYPKLTVTGPDATVNVETAEILRVMRHGVPGVKNQNSAGFFVGAFEPGINGRSRLDINVAGDPGDSNTWGSVPDVTVMSLFGNGNVAIGTAAPYSRNRLEVEMTGNKTVAVYAHAVDGTGVFGTTENGYGVIGFGGSSNVVGVLGQNIGDLGVGVLGRGYIAVYALSDQFAVVAGTTDGTGVSSTSTGGGIGVYASSFGGYGVLGHSTNSWCGYFEGESQGVFISVPPGQPGLLVSSGTKSAAVATSQGPRALYTEESTAVWFTDYGFGRLQAGRAVITIDPLFTETVNLNEPYHVFVQLNDIAAEGVAVSNKTASSFEVVELRNAHSNAEFSYRVVAKRRGYEHNRLEHVSWADDDPNLYPEKRSEWEAQQRLRHPEIPKLEIPLRISEMP